jgi:chromosome segregation ATPase
MTKVGALLVAIAIAGPWSAASAQTRGRTSAPTSSGDAPMTRADAARLRRTIEDLARQVTLLRQQVQDMADRSAAASAAATSAARRRQPTQQRFNADVARLKVISDEQSRLRQQRNELERQRRDALDRADRAQAGLDNIQSQLVNTIELDRSAAEARVRRNLTRMLDQANSDVAEAERQISLIDLRLDELERSLGIIRGRLGITPDAATEEEPEDEEPEPEPGSLDTGGNPANIP